jgi:CBS domain-containing protein
MGTNGQLNAGNSTHAATLPSTSGEITKAKDVAQYNVISINKDASVYQAIDLMVRHDITGLPVVDSTGLRGIISEKDVLKLMYDTEFIGGCVGDYMTTEVLTFDEEDDVVDICQCLMNNNFRRVPVLSHGKLVAIITRADIIRANKYRFRPAAPHDPTMSHPNFLLARHVMTSGLLTVRRNSPIYTAMDLIATGDITGLPVVDESMNIIRLLCDSEAKAGLVQDCMTREVVSFDWDDSLFEVCHCLINNNFRRIPILEKGKLTGIISRRDIIIYIMQNREHFFSQKPKN